MLQPLILFVFHGIGPSEQLLLPLVAYSNNSGTFLVFCLLAMRLTNT